MGYITNITNKSEVQMDLLLILTLSGLFFGLLCIISEITTILGRSDYVRKRFDK